MQWSNPIHKNHSIIINIKNNDKGIFSIGILILDKLDFKFIDVLLNKIFLGIISVSFKGKLTLIVPSLSIFSQL